MSELEFLGRPVMQWTEAELRRADAIRAENPTFFTSEVSTAIDARLEASEANRQMIRERTVAAAQRRMVVSFMDTATKPKQSLDARSVKHAVQDASTKKGGGPAITVAGFAAAYDWLSGHPELVDVLGKLPPVVWVVAVCGGVGWWIILFVKRLSEKWVEQY